MISRAMRLIASCLAFLCADGMEDEFLIGVIKFLYKRICNKTVFFIQRPWRWALFIICPERRYGYFFCSV